MAYLEEGYYGGGGTVAEATTSERVGFIRRTYAHLFLAIAACVALCAVLLNTPAVTDSIKSMMGAGRMAWIGVMVLFVVGGIVARGMASSASIPMQYAGLGLEVAVWSVMLMPILMFAEAKFPGQRLAMQAAIMTMVVFAGLTTAVMVSGKDFSFMGYGLMVGGFLSLGLVIAAVIFGFHLGVFFTFLMIALACGYIIYDTSNVMHHYRTDQHVIAAVILFGSVALLFYYILQLFLSSNRSE